MTSIRDRIMGKNEPKADAKAKSEPKAEAAPPPATMPDAEPPKPKPKVTLKQLTGWRDDLIDILGEIDEVDASDPYLTDAKAFGTQAVACLGKQIRAEGGDLPAGKPS